MSGPNGQITIRRATDADAVEAASLLRRSITELCVPDHGNDTARLSHWLSNKTPEHFRGWLADPLNTIFVAILDGRIASAGGIREGEGIVLNYIHPEMRFRGVSSAMMDHLEAELARSGASHVDLVSTITARRFYERRGYTERNLPPEQRPPYGIAMRKRLGL
ncbi:GNAT family N-acetyltransferase [Pelagibacterium luteolum]|uniref:Acetyltransferase (GNAT) domain-containing protein n=1 Tax=Pelagibacterium luteolum TaxID=440168 RepID=A0A1G7RSV8_9HYPH|nr:GNAT family N-acetyltransferase [Pelagibacterium luteolum]SDG13937.1 Acetyltransferase (GNAT) domain-containing protein [Pelagibacterium luteolum]